MTFWSNGRKLVLQLPLRGEGDLYEIGQQVFQHSLLTEDKTREKTLPAQANLEPPIRALKVTSYKCSNFETNLLRLIYVGVFGRSKLQAVSPLVSSKFLPQIYQSANLYTLGSSGFKNRKS